MRAGASFGASLAHFSGWCRARVEGPKIGIRVTRGYSPAACCHRVPLWAQLWSTCDLWRGGVGRWGPFTAVARLFRADGLGCQGGLARLCKIALCTHGAGRQAPGALRRAYLGYKGRKASFGGVCYRVGFGATARGSEWEGEANQQNEASPPQRFLHACGSPRAKGAGCALFWV